MRLRAILVLSAALNLALIAAFVSFRHHGWGATITADDTAAPDSAANGRTPRVVVRRQFFNWQQLESDDYRVYISNLRDIGCPEQTIRDIIIADVNELYAKKRQTDILAADQEWWHSDPDTSLDHAAAAQVQVLDQERRVLLTTLLGTNWDNSAGLVSARTGIAFTGPVLSQLAPDVKQAVLDISTAAQQRTLAYLATQSQAGKDPDPGELARIRQTARVQLSQILTPEQLEEFLLRYSQSASDLRHQLQGFDVTPDEFRKIFRATDAIDQQIALYYSSDNPTTAQQRVTLQQQLNQAIRDNLGPDRYQELVMARDPAYRDAVLTADDAGASPDAVTNLYAINIAVAQELARISNDPTLTSDQKAQAIKSIQDQQISATDQVLGYGPPTPPTPPTPQPQPQQVFVNHSYVAGETLDAIASNFGTTPDAIRSANPNTDFSQLKSGIVLRIPQPPPQTPQ
jgi:LysM repeat protein